MLKLAEPVKVYLACGSTDMRKSIDGSESLGVPAEKAHRSSLASSTKWKPNRMPRKKLLSKSAIPGVKEKKPKKKKLRNHPIKTIEYRLSEAEQVCTCCGGPLHEMSKQERVEVEYAPPVISGIKHVQYLYACRNCEKNEIKTLIVTAPAPKPAIPNSIASPSMIACVMNQKFTMGLPLYRQEQDFTRQGITISRQTMANWMILASDKWLKQLYERMREHLRKQDILHADETTLQVLHEPDRKAESTSYMWLYRTGRDGPPIILYDYQTTRSGKHPARFLKEFKGYLHTDGYGGYNGLPNIIPVGCWAHARRKFDAALKALPASQRNTPTVAGEGLDFCNKLFAIERELHDVTPEERYQIGCSPIQLREPAPAPRFIVLWRRLKKMV